METHLVLYEAAKIAVKRARDVDEAKEIYDEATRFRVRAEQAKDNSLIAWSTELQVRAARECGAYLVQMKVNGARHNGRNLGGKPLESSTMTPALTLDDLGISKNQSSSWQKFAEISEEAFDEAVTVAKDATGRVTTAAMIRVAKSKKPAAAKKPTSVATIDEATGAVDDEPRKERPAPRAKEQAVPLSQHEALKEKYEELSAKFDELMEELETCEAIRSGEEAKEMNTLRQLLKQAERARDDRMRETVQMRKQIDSLTRELKKLAGRGSRTRESMGDPHG